MNSLIEENEKLSKENSNLRKDITKITEIKEAKKIKKVWMKE